MLRRQQGRPLVSPPKALEIVSYHPDHRQAWDEFVASSTNGTVFHQRQFLAYHPEGRFGDCSMLAFDGKRIVSVMPAALRQDDELGSIVVSHPGASYGGPVFSPKASAATVMASLEGFEARARELGNALQMRLPPHVFHRVPLESLEFALKFRGYAILASELSCAVDLSAIDGSVLASVTSMCRRAIKKAQRSDLVCEVSDDYAQYWEVLRDNLRQHHDVNPTHSLEEILHLRELLGDAVRLVVARRGDRIVAGTVLFRCNAHSAHTFYMASRDEDRDARPLNLVLHDTLELLRDEGLRHLNFGVSTPGGKSINWGLLRFKESFGGHGVYRDSYRKVF